MPAAALEQVGFQRGILSRHDNFSVLKVLSKPKAFSDDTGIWPRTRLPRAHRNKKASRAPMKLSLSQKTAWGFFAAAGTVRSIGLVNMIPGDVAYAAQAGTHDKIRQFMKVRDGERIKHQRCGWRPSTNCVLRRRAPGTLSEPRQAFGRGRWRLNQPQARQRCCAATGARVLARLGQWR